MKFSFDGADDRHLNINQKSFSRPSHFYKKQENNEKNKDECIFLTSTNAEAQTIKKKSKVRSKEKSKSYHENLVSFEMNVSKSEIMLFPNETSQYPSLKIPLFSEENNKFNDTPAFKNPEDKKKDYMRKKYLKLIKNLSFQAKGETESKYKYNFFGIMPYVFFLKFLAKPNITDENSECIKLNLPDTIIINDDDLAPMWLYTSKNGFLRKNENFLMKEILERFGILESPDELVAVLKRPRYENQILVGNDLKLFSTRDLNTWCNGFLLGRRGEMNVIQRFVKPKGPRAFINRTVWKRDGKNYAWMITNKVNFNNNDKNCKEYNKYCTNFNIMNSCSIINITKGKTLEDTVPYLNNIVKYFDEHKKLKFDELIGDFIKDESGIWWLINIKGFIINDPNYLNSEKIVNYLQDFKKTNDPSIPPKKAKYKKLKKCKYCEIPYDESELIHKISKRMIIQIDLHLINRGKDFDWLQRSIHLKNLTPDVLCREHFVCDSCYHLYKELEELIKYENEFAHYCGIQTTNENTFYNLNISLASFGKKQKLRSKSWNLFIHNKFQDNLSNFEMPENWSFYVDPLSEIMILNNEPRKFINNNNSGIIQDYLHRYRFIIFLSSIDEIPFEYQFHNNFYLNFNLFDQTIKYKLNFSDSIETNEGTSLFLNKLKTFYFYCTDKEKIKYFLKNQKVLSINLCQKDSIVGTVYFELDEFCNDLVVKREFYKYIESRFSESQTNKILNCGFDLAIGLYQGPYINVKHIQLQEHKGVYIPPKNYYTCDPFPDEWFNMLKRKRDLYRRSICKSENEIKIVENVIKMPNFVKDN